MARGGWLPPGPGGIRQIGEIHLLRSAHRARATHRGRLQCNFVSAGFGLGTGTAVNVSTATDLLTTSTAVDVVRSLICMLLAPASKMLLAPAGCILVAPPSMLILPLICLLLAPAICMYRPRPFRLTRILALDVTRETYSRISVKNETNRASSSKLTLSSRISDLFTSLVHL